MRIILIVLCVVGLIPTGARTQGSAGSNGKIEPRYLIDIPTAGMLAKGDVAFDVHFYQEGGILLGLSAGVLDRLFIGVSYGGSRLIGAQSPEMNDLPGLHVKVRVIEENIVLPAIVVGFDSQGKDGYIESLDRYTIKSPGLYAAASKNYLLMGYLSIHGGLNYSFERQDDDKDFNVFFGLEKTVGPFASIILEYNLAANDNAAKAIGKGRGYLNAGVKVAIGGGLTFGVNVKDIVKNGNDVSVGNRTVAVEFVTAI